jgi:hypothetical protein
MAVFSLFFFTFLFRRVPNLLRVNRKEQVHSVPTDESIEDYEETEEKEGPPEGGSSSAQQKGNPRLESHNRHTYRETSLIDTVDILSLVAIFGYDV